MLEPVAEREATPDDRREREAEAEPAPREMAGLVPAPAGAPPSESTAAGAGAVRAARGSSKPSHADTGAQVLPVVAMRWRVEVQKRGKYWQWRFGSGRMRISRYGGKFELLSQERQAEYAQNKARNRPARDA